MQWIMNERNSFQDTFDQYFEKYKNVPIAIYGTGNNAELILKNVTGYDFFALISAEPQEETWCGKKIISIEEAVKKAGMILIAAVPSSTSIVYTRIKNIVPDTIPVYDMRGQSLNGEEYYKHNIYWKKRLCELYRLIDSYDVISFDVFDTLIMRKVLQPSDIFLIVEAKLKKKRKDIPFAKWRTEAEKKISSTCCPTFEKIYETMQKLYHLDEAFINELQQIEIRTELESLCCRKKMVQLLQYAFEKGKKIYLTSDMYFTKDKLGEILENCGIGKCYELIISCEYNASKQNGRLYQLLRCMEGGRRILHIGDNDEADIKNAIENGLDAFHIMSGYEMLASSSIAYIIENVKSLDESILLGNFIADMFNDPFALNPREGKINLGSFHDLSQCFIPITVLFLNFILEKSRLYDVILFCSRDGYFLNELYQMAKSGEDFRSISKNIYFYASRSAVNSSAVYEENDLYVVCNKILEDRKLNIKQFFKIQFMIETAKELDITVEQALEQWGEDGLWKRILCYKETILKNARENRKRYRKYIERVGISNSQKIAVVDIVTQGTLIYGLSKIIGTPVELIALGTSAMPNQYVWDMGRVHAVYGNVNNRIQKTVYSLSDFSELHLFLEIIYASCEGQFIGFDRNGGRLTQEYEYDKELVCGIQDEVRKIMQKNKMFYGLKISKEFALDFLRILYSKNSDMDENLKKGFRFKDPYDSNKQECNLMESIG